VKTKTLKIILAPFLIALVLGIYIGRSQTPTSIFYISPGPYPGAPTYTIWQEGNNYFAKTGHGELKFSGTDASYIIQKAIDNLTNGGKIMIKTGIYTIDTKITIPETIYPYSLIIEGEGIKNTVLQWDTSVSGDYLLEAYASTSGRGIWLIMRDLRLKGGDSSTNVTALRLGRSVAGAVAIFTLRNVMITHCDTPAVLMDYVQNSWFYDCTFESNTYPGWDIYARSASHLQIFGGSILSIYLSNSQLRAYGLSTKTIVFRDGVNYQHIISGVSFDAPISGHIYNIQIGTVDMVRKVIIEGCTFLVAPPTGGAYIFVNNAKDVRIELNHYISTTEYYIKLRANASRCTVILPSDVPTSLVGDIGTSNQIRYMGTLSHNQGSFSSIANGTYISHGLLSTPTSIDITLTIKGNVWLGTVNATHFQVYADITPISGYWSAWYLP